MPTGDADAQRIADEVLGREPVTEGDFPDPPVPSGGAPDAGRKPRVRKPGESLIQVSLGEPEGHEEASTEDAAPLPVDRAALRERSPDIDLGERRRRPRPTREQPDSAPYPDFDQDVVPPMRPAIAAQEPVIDEADEKAFHEQSLAFDRPSTDDETADLTASSLKTDREIVYRDLGGRELDTSASVAANDDGRPEQPVDADDASEAERSAGSYGLLRRAYERIANALRKVSVWFGIRDERTDR